MAEITVKLRVVGIYFNRLITFDDGGKPVTIETLHNAAMLQYPINRVDGIFFTGSFQRPDGILDPEGNPIRTVSHNYSGKYDFNGNGFNEGSTADRQGETLGGKLRPPGTYELSEQLIENGLLAWQYYVKRGETIVSRTKSSRKFDSYQGFPLQNGDSVTWRLVSIATKPLVSD
jgi:hypothetical protein